MNRNFFIKCSILLFVVCLIFISNIYIDPFDVFHWNDIRFTSATPNKNFIKTKYILSQPNKHNAFLLGSSRIGPLPPYFLPQTLNGKKLNWYNMTYSSGIPKENLETIKTFVKNGVKIDMAVVQFDDLAMHISTKRHKKENITMPYQVYEQNKFYFYFKYLKVKNELSFIREILKYDRADNEKHWKRFYAFGTFGIEMDLEDIPPLKESELPDRYKTKYSYSYTEKDSYKDIEEIVEFCRQNNIKLILLTSALFQTTYLQAVDAGYFDFLKKVAQKCEFYNFSSLNNYTKDYRYFMEYSHFTPNLGVLVEKILFGSEEEKSKIREEAGDEFWGEKVNASNVDFIIQKLKEQLPN